MLESSHAEANRKQLNKENIMTRQTVKTNLLKVNLKVGNYKLATKLALQIEVEGEGFVYLDNAYHLLKDHITRHQFAGYLGALAKDGFYKETTDQHFGQIEI